MCARPSLPLTEPQQRSLAVTLTILERDLQRLRDTLDRPPRDLRLTRYDDPLPAVCGPVLLSAAADIDGYLAKLIADLGLEPRIEPVRRSITSRLMLDRVHLEEMQPSGGLSGYGEVDARTAKYLDSEIPKLQALIDGLIERIEAPTSTVKNNAR